MKFNEFIQKLQTIGQIHGDKDMDVRVSVTSSSSTILSFEKWKAKWEKEATINLSTGETWIRTDSIDYERMQQKILKVEKKGPDDNGRFDNLEED